ncbi:guanine deaminase [Asaia bogorensis]|uniref:Guanine deaminase n=1 Tax=Asaia bogorensis NBRC 16594 TaxID=1231624 RepID=A0AAN4R4H1_9PROT|nr:guanine deaminase [Asaia bogorensis]BAT19332.1 guanine deaminase [Asaia bogorensis NBRC 16594]GBQ82188.1 guanine deaminase [Asaia bogorensis NBRC 16594]GEL54173.1 guanine deaminase [Asaia bogorensis NBRC 16594]
MSPVHPASAIPDPSPAAPRLALRGTVLRFVGNPFDMLPDEALSVDTDGLVIIENGRISAVGSYDQLAPGLKDDSAVIDHRGSLIGPGFIDTHVHYPQLGVIASYGEQLLTWLERYVFPEERRFAEQAYARRIASDFLDNLLHQGTTTAAVYCTVHPESVEAFFSESTRRNTRMIAGKVLMDRNAPDYLRDTAQGGYDESRRLIDKWHGRGRQLYAVTPRFAPTSTEAQLDLAGALLDTAPDLFMQTHLLETLREEEWVRSLFPHRTGYLDVYDKAGLVRPRSIFGHAVHVNEQDLTRCAHAGCTLAHCPTSNAFLGSGAFRLFDAMRPDRRVHVGLGTDIGGGNSLSMLRVMNDAYCAAQSHGTSLHPVQAYWLATAGAAQALGLQHQIGQVEPGLEADLCVMDPYATPLMAQRAKRAETVSDLLFALSMLGDDRAISATYVMGLRHQRPTP